MTSIKIPGLPPIRFHSEVPGGHHSPQDTFPSSRGPCSRSKALLRSFLPRLPGSQVLRPVPCWTVSSFPHRILLTCGCSNMPQGITGLQAGAFSAPGFTGQYCFPVSVASGVAMGLEVCSGDELFPCRAIKFSQLNLSDFTRGFPGGSDGKESTCNVGDPGLIPGSRRFPWRRKWQPTPEFLSGEFHGQGRLSHYSPWGHND